MQDLYADMYDTMIEALSHVLVHISSWLLQEACTSNNLLEALLTEFSTIFTEPYGLPPQRTYDHNIALVPSLQPEDVWPYQYPATYKDELERHSLLGTKMFLSVCPRPTGKL